MKYSITALMHYSVEVDEDEISPDDIDDISDYFYDNFNTLMADECCDIEDIYVKR